VHHAQVGRVRGCSGVPRYSALPQPRARRLAALRDQQQPIVCLLPLSTHNLAASLLSVSLNETEVTRGVDADQADKNKQKFKKSLAADYILQS
jgi:hypothetical protein